MNGQGIRRKPLPAEATTRAFQTDVEMSLMDGRQSDERSKAEENQGAWVNPREGWPRWRWPLVAGLNAIYFLLIGYDVGCIANIQAPIYQTFGQLPMLPWVALGYVAIGVAVVPMVRKVLDICDLRWQVPAYGALLFIGAAVSGSAQNVETVIVGRCLTGFGGAGIFQLVLAYYTMLCKNAAEYARLSAVCACCWAIGLALGPIIAAGFAENVTWRWALYINLPILGLVLGLSILAYPSARMDMNGTAAAYLRSFDWVGSVLYFTSFIVLFCCLMFSGTRWPWSDTSTIVAWVFVIAGFTAVFRQQIYSHFTTVEHRLLPMDLLGMRPVLLTVLATSGIGAAYGVVIYYTPLFFAFVHGRGPVAAGARLLAFTGSFIGCSLLGAGTIPRVKYYAPYYIISGICITVGSGLLTQMSPRMSESEVMGYSALVGVGAGISWPLALTVLTLNVPPARKRDISAMFIVFQTGGIALALAIAACMYRNMGFQLLVRALRDSGLALGDIREVMAGLASETVERMTPEDRARTIEIITQIIGRFYWMLVGAGGVVTVSGCLMDFKPLDFE